MADVSRFGANDLDLRTCVYFSRFDSKWRTLAAGPPRAPGGGPRHKGIGGSLAGWAIGTLRA